MYSSAVEDLGFSLREAIESPEGKLLRVYLSYTLSRLRELLATRGININVPRASSWTHFESLDFATQTKVTERIVNYHEFLAELIEHEINIDNNSDVLKYFLNKHGLTVDQEFFKTIDDNDVVEVYDLEFTQLYRNFKLLELTDYDILIIESMPWPNLFGRHESITKQIINASMTVLIPSPGIHKLQIQPHIMQELKTPSKKLFKIQHRYATPLYLKERCVGLACTQSAEHIVSESKNLDFIRK